MEIEKYTPSQNLIKAAVDKYFLELQSDHGIVRREKYIPMAFGLANSSFDITLITYVFHCGFGRLNTFSILVSMGFQVC